MNGMFPLERAEGVFLFLGQLWQRFEEMKLHGGCQFRKSAPEAAEQVPGEGAGIGALFDQAEPRWTSQDPMKLVRLSCQKISQNRPWGDGGEKVPLCPGASFSGGIKTVLRMIEGLGHKMVERQGALLPDLTGQDLT